MAYVEYTAEEYTEACRLLLEMRDNCLKTYGENEYSDPKKEQKAKALNIALDAIDRIDWKHNRGDNMIITGMEHFQSVCKKKLVEWYNDCNKNKAQVNGDMPRIDLSNVFVVWSCKTLQNYKALLSTTVSGDGIYAEYTYNGDKQELYEDVYVKQTNTCITEE